MHGDVRMKGIARQYDWKNMNKVYGRENIKGLPLNPSAKNNQQSQPFNHSANIF